MTTDIEIGSAEVWYANSLIEKAIKEEDCLLCHLKPISAGYSYIWLEGKRVRASRFIYTVFKGPIPEGHFVLHECDNPRCINPEHLFPGTAQDNTQDMLTKGRHWFIHNDTRKVTTEIKDEMLKLRQNGYSATYIANKLGIAPSTVYEYTSPNGRRR